MDKKDVPIVKLFIIDGHYYMYDTYSNSILEVNSLQYKELNIATQIGTEAYLSLPRQENEYQNVCMLIRKGFLKSKIIDEVENPLTPYLEQLLKSCVCDLVLQVTKDCNFKCRYCGFANTTGIDRNHEHENMSWEIAKESIDFLYMHSRDIDLVSIAFYGGEPLLNFPLIYKATQYANKNFKSKKIVYRMTTNASLLSDRIIDFLVENSFLLSLSIDGPQKTQDIHRTFRQDGKGTYTKIY